MAFLAPTTVLAAQHLRVLRKRMPEVRVESEPEPEPDPKPDPNPDPNPNPKVSRERLSGEGGGCAAY